MALLKAAYIEMCHHCNRVARIITPDPNHSTPWFMSKEGGRFWVGLLRKHDKISLEEKEILLEGIRNSPLPAESPLEIVALYEAAIEEGELPIVPKQSDMVC